MSGNKNDLDLNPLLHKGFQVLLEATREKAKKFYRLLQQKYRLESLGPPIQKGT